MQSAQIALFIWDILTNWLKLHILSSLFKWIERMMLGKNRVTLFYLPFLPKGSGNFMEIYKFFITNERRNKGIWLISLITFHQHLHSKTLGHFSLHAFSWWCNYTFSQTDHCVFPRTVTRFLQNWSQWLLASSYTIW